MTPAAPRATNPPIWLLACAAFTVGCGMRLLDPLLPMLAREFAVGLGEVAPLIGGFAIAYGLGQLASGPLGDRFGKLRVAGLAVILYAATLLAASQAPGLGALLGMRVLSGLAAAAVIPLLMAHIADTVPYETRQGVIGRFLTGMVMAQLLAGPVSGAVGEHFGWRATFLLLGGAAALVGLVFALRLGPALWRVPEGPARGAGMRGFLRLFDRAPQRRLMLAAGLDGMLLFGGALPFVASLLIEGFGLSATEAGLAAAGFGLGSLVYTRAAPVLVKRYGERGMVLRGGAGLAACLAAIGLAPAWWVAAAAQAAAGLVFFMFHGVLQARATEAVPEARGTAVAGFAMVLFLGQSLGAVVFGALIVGAGFGAAFLVAAAGILATALWVRAAVIPRR
ncbi:MFS transporter [Falsiroseomonas sp. CW058]|uniref:MFS transporter n=1 Tax=Falsiroseomonas sp. CW058 TaxID=3388664 RepID=UPI003D319150